MAAASGLPLARSAHAAGSEAIKIGMLGCGGRCSGAAAQALSLGKDVKLAGMNDVFEKRSEAGRSISRRGFRTSSSPPTRLAPTAWRDTKK